MPKICGKCKQNKPFSSFDTSELQPDGYCGWCQLCQETYGIAALEEREKVREQRAAQNKRKKEEKKWAFLLKNKEAYFDVGMSLAEYERKKRKQQQRKLRKHKATQKQRTPQEQKIELAARQAKNTAVGIIVDGVKLSIPIKVCRDKNCAVQYPATRDYFHENKQTKDGWSGKCKKCTKKATKHRPGRKIKLTDAEKEENVRKQRVKRQAIQKEAQKQAAYKQRNKEALNEIGKKI